MKSLDLWEHTLVVGASDNVRAAFSVPRVVWADLLLGGVVPMPRLMVGAEQLTAGTLDGSIFYRYLSSYYPALLGPRDKSSRATARQFSGRRQDRCY